MITEKDYKEAVGCCTVLSLTMGIVIGIVSSILYRLLMEWLG